MLKHLGGGLLVSKFVENFLTGSKQYVIVNEAMSDEWSLDVGSGQGHVLSPTCFNIGTVSQYYWTLLSTLFGYADDGSDLISAPTIAECNDKIRQVIAARQEWYKLAGIAPNIEKTTLMGVGFRPEPVTIENTTIEPVMSFKFLGMLLQDDLGLDQHVRSVSSKIRHAPSKIRGDGQHFTISD